MVRRDSMRCQRTDLGKKLFYRMVDVLNVVPISVARMCLHRGSQFCRVA